MQLNNKTWRVCREEWHAHSTTNMTRLSVQQWGSSTNPSWRRNYLTRLPNQTRWFGEVMVLQVKSNLSFINNTMIGNTDLYFKKMEKTWVHSINMFLKEVKFAAAQGTCIRGKKVLGTKHLDFPIHDRNYTWPTGLDYKKGNRITERWSILRGPTLITVMKSQCHFPQGVPLQAMRLTLALTRVHSRVERNNSPRLWPWTPHNQRVNPAI